MSCATTNSHLIDFYLPFLSCCFVLFSLAPCIVQEWIAMLSSDSGLETTPNCLPFHFYLFCYFGLLFCAPFVIQERIDMFPADSRFFSLPTLLEKKSSNLHLSLFRFILFLSFCLFLFSFCECVHYLLSMILFGAMYLWLLWAYTLKITCLWYFYHLIFFFFSGCLCKFYGKISFSCGIPLNNSFINLDPFVAKFLKILFRLFFLTLLLKLYTLPFEVEFLLVRNMFLLVCNMFSLA